MHQQCAAPPQPDPRKPTVNRSSRFVLLLGLLLPAVTWAQPSESPAAPVEQVAPAAPATPAAAAPTALPAPAEPRWSVGAGLSFFSWSSSSSLLSRSSATYQSAPSLGAEVQPRLGLLIERRIGNHTWVQFQLDGTYASSQDDEEEWLSARRVDLDASLGLRRVFNPGGVIEVSYWGALGAGYANSLSHSRYTTTYYYPSSSSDEWVIDRSHSFSIGATVGLAFERELTEGLFLRLSSSLLGASWAQVARTVTTNGVDAESSSHETDLGLRFSPALEVRYRF